MGKKKVYIAIDRRHGTIEAAFTTEKDAEAYASRETRAGGSFEIAGVKPDMTEPFYLSGKIAFEVTYETATKLFLSTPEWHVKGESYMQELPFEDIEYSEIESSYHEDRTNLEWITWVWADDKTEALKVGKKRMIPEIKRKLKEQIVVE